MITIFNLHTLIDKNCPMTQSMLNTLQHYKKHSNLCVLSKNTFGNIKQQLENHIYLFDYVCSEFGTVIHSNILNEFVLCQTYNILDDIPDITELQSCITNFIDSTQYLKQFNKLQLPTIEIRTGIIYINPIGINNHAEKAILDKTTLVQLQSLIQIPNIACKPCGTGLCLTSLNWSKSYIIDFFKKSRFTKIVYITSEIDELFNHMNVDAYEVECYHETTMLCKKLITLTGHARVFIILT